jgi:hypothetical protein
VVLGRKWRAPRNPFTNSHLWKIVWESGVIGGTNTGMAAAAAMLGNMLIQNGEEVFGRRDWTRTNDPHHVKGDES